MKGSTWYLMNKNQIKTELEKLIHNNVDPVMFPYVNGNSIRIGKMVVRTSRGRYAVIDTTTGSMIGKYFCKASALAVAKSLAKGQTVNSIKGIEEIDHNIAKHSNDCIFFKHTMQTSKDATRRDVAEIRYENAFERAQYYKTFLDKYIFN